jgi:ABC-2 type transport system ATP-binding protein
VTHAIEAEGLVKTYPGDVRALDGLSFAVEEGTVFALLGPNGAGKSTAVKILTTLARPDAGAGRVAGADVLTEPGTVRRRIGCVSQRPGVDREATGRENLRLQGQVHGLRGPELERRAGALLERFGLADAADRIARGYSGGMERRLDIAMALVHRPSVLFLDEPTTGLDPEVRADMWEEISRLANEQGLTILLTTHYLEEADHLADRLAIVDRGRVVVDGTPDELKRGLRGDAVTIELADGAGDAVSLVQSLGRVEEATLDGRILRARAQNGPQAVPAIISTLDAGGIPVAAVTVARPSLDDVYLHFTGRDFASADREGA